MSTPSNDLPLDICKVPYTVVFAKIVPDDSIAIQEDCCSILQLGISVSSARGETSTMDDRVVHAWVDGGDGKPDTNCLEQSNACYNAAQSYPISVDDFICNFYDCKTGQFAMQATPPNADRIRQELILAPKSQTNWHILNYQRDVTTGKRYLKGVDSRLNLADDVISQWERDVCALINDWEVCSANSVLRQLSDISVVSNLSCDVKCALNIEELQGALMAADNLANVDSYKSRQKSINAGYYGFLEGDEVALAIRINNRNEKASCIELRLNFRICGVRCLDVNGEDEAPTHAESAVPTSGGRTETTVTPTPIS